LDTCAIAYFSAGGKAPKKKPAADDEEALARKRSYAAGDELPSAPSGKSVRQKSDWEIENAAALGSSTLVVR
jgi:hypothetical protein